MIYPIYKRDMIYPLLIICYISHIYSIRIHDPIFPLVKLPYPNSVQSVDMSKGSNIKRKLVGGKHLI